MYALSQVKHPRHKDGDEDEARPQASPARTLTQSSWSDAAAKKRAASGSTEKSGGGPDTVFSASWAKTSVARMTDDEIEEEANDYYMGEGEVAVPSKARGTGNAGLKPHAATVGAVAVAGPPRETKGSIMATRPSQAVARMHPYEMEEAIEDCNVEDEGDDSYLERERILVPAASRNTTKAGALRTGSTAVGAVAVAGRGEQTRPRGNTIESSYQDSFGSEAESAGSEVKGTDGDKPPTQDQPIEATCVSDTEADIEAQVQSRMQNQAKDIAHLVHKELMTNAAVPVEVQQSVQETSSVMKSDYGTGGDSQKKKKICTVAIILLAIIAAVGAGVGVAVSKKPPDEPKVPTQPPTSPPTPVTTRSEVFQEFLAPISGEQLNDTNSPQFKALTWLANNDAANMTIGVDSEAAIKTRYVAAVLYYAFRGDTWANKYRFLSDRETCSWNQKFIDGYHGLSCGADGTVESFQTPANNLVGSIPSEIGYYGNLIDLDLSNNTIDGSIAALVNLTRLEKLNCSMNALTGTLPEFLFTHRSLTDIDLQDNRFFGSIGESLGESDQLRVFWLRNNSLTGTIPLAVGQSWVLGSLDLSSNQLTGTIPGFTSSSRIWNLHLGQNKLTGTIPTTVGSLSALKTFDLAGNGNGRSGISGRIPSELGKCQNLFFLWLDNNTLAESIPTDLGSISSLQELYIANNRLTGSIPAALGNAQTLSRIDLQGNYLTGDIGLVIDLLPRSLELFVVGGNQLQGTIPTSVGSFSSLTNIDVGRNNMNGTIPSQFGNATSLEELRLGENNFEGTLPTSIASLPNLLILHIYGNELSGSLDEFCNIWDNPFELKYFAANKCGEPEDILCPCCNVCCSIDIFECRAI